MHKMYLEQYMDTNGILQIEGPLYVTFTLEGNGYQ